MSGDISIYSCMLDDEITFNFKGSIICYPSKLKHSQNIYFKVKGNCYNMTPSFLYNVRNCFINFKFATKLKCYVSLKLRQYTPISKMDRDVALWIAASVPAF